MTIRQGLNIIAGSGGGIANYDGISITENASEEIQTVGVIDQNDTTQALKQWSGTLAQYNAIQSKDSNTLYNVIDDTDVSLPILEALYPVGSVYITTANTCPLSTLISGSTWVLVGSGVVTAVSSASTAPVKGTGKALGITNGSQTGGLGAIGSGITYTNTASYNQNVGYAATWGQNAVTNTIGLTTDETKSGIIADTSSLLTTTTLSVNIFERAA